jgi:hypothetical protein
MFAGNAIEWNANFAAKSIFSKGFSYSFKRFYEELNGPGNAISSAEIPFVFISFKKKSRTWSFMVSERISAHTHFDHEILKFIDEGTQPYYGKNEEFGPVNFTGNYYREISVGVAQNIWEGFSIGIRPKLLFGKYYYNTQNTHFFVETDQDAQQLHIRPDGSYTVAGPVAFITINENNITVSDINFGDYFLNFKNMGIAVDLGFTYTFDNKSTIQANILDLGFKGFNYKSFEVAFNDTLMYAFDELYQSNNPDGSNYIEPKEALRKLNAELQNVTQANKLEKRRFVTLPINIHASYSYAISRKWQTGISAQFTYIEKYSDTYLSGYVKSNLNQKTELVFNLNLFDNKYIFPGLGFSYSGEKMQYFVATDNILKLIQPASAKNLNLRFGMSFLFSTEN